MAPSTWVMRTVCYGVLQTCDIKLLGFDGIFPMAADFAGFYPIFLQSRLRSPHWKALFLIFCGVLCWFAARRRGVGGR